MPLGKLSNITIPYWEKDQFEYTDGDLPLSSAEPTGKPVVRPGTGRLGVCGTDEDFREGGLYAPLLPPATYGNQGLPTCCGAPVLVSPVAVDGGVNAVTHTLAGGVDCASSVLLPLGTEFLLEPPPVTATWWLKHPVTAGKTYRYTVTPDPDFSSAVLYEGPDCANLTTMSIFILPPPFVDVTATATDWFWFEYVSILGGGVRFRLRVDELP